MVMINDKISVVIPSYNRAELLKKAVSSLQCQTYTHIEIIIVDDCSNDHTASVVEEMNDNRIIYIRHEKNRGGSEARNTGIQQASGKYIAFLDSDDQWLPEKLALQLGVFRNNPDIGVVYTGVKLVENDKLIREIVPEYKGNILRELIESNCIDTTSSIMVKKDLLINVGGFDSAIPSCQDWDLYLRLAQITEFDFVKEPMVLFYQHQGERITTNKIARLNGHVYIFNKFLELAKQQGTIVLRKFVFNIWKNIFKTGILNQDHTSIKVSRKILRKGMKKSRFPVSFLLYYSCTFINLKVLRFLYDNFKKSTFKRLRLSNSVSAKLT